MKIVVIGGSGLIGTKVVKNLRDKGHEVVAASPSKGINSVTGEGLAEAFAGAQVVVDVANAPSYEDKAVLEFFETSGRNLLPAEAAAGVGHHVALSVRRHRPPARQWLLPREAGPGESDQGLAGSSGAASIRKLQWGQAARPARRRGDRQQEIVKLNSKVRVRDERGNVRASRSRLAPARGAISKVKDSSLDLRY